MRAARNAVRAIASTVFAAPSPRVPFASPAQPEMDSARRSLKANKIRIPQAHVTERKRAMAEAAPELACWPTTNLATTLRNARGDIAWECPKFACRPE